MATLRNENQAHTHNLGTHMHDHSFPYTAHAFYTSSFDVGNSMAPCAKAAEAGYHHYDARAS